MASATGPRPDPGRRTHLGVAAGELDGKWYAKYWNPVMAPLPDAVREAIGLGPQAVPLGLRLDEAAALAGPGYHELENGYSLHDDGSMHVAVLTPMPGVAPAMWDWWFWWHATETERYKLWYPRAHVYAEWSPGTASQDGPYRDRYVGGTSFVDEYVGSMLGELAIRFVPPAQLGFDTGKPGPDEATVICGTVGFSGIPLDWGHLLHYVRRVDGGSEMRSRFWMGGGHVTARGGADLAGDLAAAADAVRHLGEAQARAMVVHCSQEMNHPAAFLPGIHREYEQRQQP